jgi:hypothetical protein
MVELFQYHPWKWAFVMAYASAALLCWNKASTLFDPAGKNILFALAVRGAEILTAFLLVAGFLIALAAIGRPFGTFFVQRRLRRIGFTNHLGQYPLLVSRHKDKNKSHGLIYKFANMGIDLETFEKKVSALGQCLNANIRFLELSKNPAYTFVYATPRKHDKPSLISTASDYLIRDLINLLCVGNTGSGKSVALYTILVSIARFNPTTSITICDYKKSSFAQFEDTPNFYGYEDVPDGIRAFYREFTERLEANDEQRNSKKRVLMIDEYGALIAAQEKKPADELKMMIANMLFMSRSLGLIVIIGVQRADAEHFKAGARDQFKAVLGLGNLSKEQKQMLFTEHKDKMIANNSVGEGYLLVDGQELERVKIIPGEAPVQDSLIRQAMYY